MNVEVNFGRLVLAPVILIFGMSLLVNTMNIINIISIGFYFL